MEGVALPSLSFEVDQGFIIPLPCQSLSQKKATPNWIVFYEKNQFLKQEGIWLMNQEVKFLSNIVGKLYYLNILAAVVNMVKLSEMS